MTKIIIGADLVPTKSNIEYFEKGLAETLVGTELLAVLNSADYRIFNLEVPLTDVAAPILKCGPNLIAPAKTIKGMKALGVDFFTLANNHILDQGVQGLFSTEKILDQASIYHAGTGRNAKEAAVPFQTVLDGSRLAIYCCAEHEFSAATETTAGANGFDPLFSLDHIREIRKNADYVIVLYHGGKEHYRYPSPDLRKICRRIVDCGANLVICQHTHCIGCEEKWDHGTIVYGQGNFLFDDSESDFWQTSLLVQVNLDGDRAEIEYIPIVKEKNTVRLASVAIADQILRDYHNRSQQIKNPGFVQERYSEFAESCLNAYLRTGVPLDNLFVIRILNKLYRSKWFVRQIKLEKKLALLNYLKCEAHRELFSQGLMVCINSSTDKCRRSEKE